MHFKGSSVVKDGSCRETNPPYEDEPKEGKKPDLPPPPKEEKKGFDWGKLALVAVATVGAAKAGQNNINSQLAKNGGDNSKIDYGEVLKAEFFGAVTGAKDMALTEACAAYDVLNQTASFFADVCTLGKIHNSCKDFSDWSHDFLRNIAPYKEGFDDAEFVINTALLADGLLSVSNIVRNFPKKFSIGQISLAELGINMPVLCSDGSIALATPGDLASMQSRRCIP